MRVDKRCPQCKAQAAFRSENGYACPYCGHQAPPPDELAEALEAVDKEYHAACDDITARFPGDSEHDRRMRDEHCRVVQDTYEHAVRCAYEQERLRRRDVIDAILYFTAGLLVAAVIVAYSTTINN